MAQCRLQLKKTEMEKGSHPGVRLNDSQTAQLEPLTLTCDFTF